MRACVLADLRDFGQAVDQAVEIEACAADDAHRAASILRFTQVGQGGAQPFTGRPGHVGRQVPVKHMIGARQIRRIRPRRQDRHIGIELHRIGIEDQAVGSIGPLQRLGRFPGCRRPGQQIDRSGFRHFTL